MKCLGCQHENPGDSVFCQECGTRLETGCPSCGTPNLLSAKFCKKCGHRLSGPQAEPAMLGPRFGPPENYSARGVDALVETDVDRLVRFVADGVRPGAVVLVMSNGAFGGFIDRLLTALRRPVHGV